MLAKLHTQDTMRGKWASLYCRGIRHSNYILPQVIDLHSLKHKQEN